MKRLLLCCFLLPVFLHAQTDSLPADTTIDVKVPKLFFEQRGFRIRFSAGGNQVFRTLESTKFNKLHDCRKEHEQPANTVTATLSGEYWFHKNFAVKFGVHYLETGFDFSEAQQWNDTLTYEFGAGCDVDHLIDPSWGFIYTGFIDPRYPYTISGLHPSSGELHFKARYALIDLPVQLQYVFGHRRLKGYVGAGASVNWMAKDLSVIEAVSGGRVLYSASFKDHSPYGIFRRWNFSMLASAGIRYALDHRWSVDVSANYQQQLMSVFDSAYYKDYVERHYAFGLTAGVQYRIEIQN